MATRLTKALRSLSPTDTRLQKASRGALSGYVPAASSTYGQPRTDDVVDTSNLITYERMRQVVLRTPTAAAAVNAIIDYATGVLIYPHNVDETQPPPPRLQAYIESLMDRPNPVDTWRHMIQKTFRDMSTLGFAAWEVEPNAAGKVANLWPLDAARLQLDFDEHGTVLGYNMLSVNGDRIIGRDGVHTWTPDEVIFFKLNPVSFSQNASSRITQLYTAAIIEDMMLAFIGGRFTESNTPYGVFDMGDITETEVKRAIEYWNTQVKSGHRILLTGSKGAKWFPFGYHLKDLEATELLSEVRGKIMAVLGVTMNELGESQDVNKSNGYNLSYTFKKRAIEPLLDEFTTTLTRRLLHDILGFTQLEFSYDEIDSRDELLGVQIYDMLQKQGSITVNQIRNDRGDPSVEGGDIPYIWTGSAWIPVHLLERFAMAQLNDLEAVYEQTQIAIQQAKLNMMMQIQQMQMMQAGGAVDSEGNPIKLPPLPEQLISLPLIRPPQMPNRGTTPLGSGSTNAKVKYPKARINSTAQLPAAAPGTNPQRSRGPVQTARNTMGQRKEDR
jgi:hypothetical protein